MRRNLRFAFLWLAFFVISVFDVFMIFGKFWGVVAIFIVVIFYGFAVMKSASDADDEMGYG